MMKAEQRVFEVVDGQSVSGLVWHLEKLYLFESKFWYSQLDQPFLLSERNLVTHNSSNKV